jgi:uncharacterized protein YjdB
MSRCNSIITKPWLSLCRNLLVDSTNPPAIPASHQTSWLSLVLVAMFAIIITACGSGGGGGGGGSTTTSSSPPDFVVSGSVSAPGGVVAFNQQKELFNKFSDVIFAPAYASSSFQAVLYPVSGFLAVADGTQIDLVRINAAGAVVSTLSTATTSGGIYSFNLTKLGLATASDLVVQVASQSTGIKMRAFVGADGVVNIDPTSEASVRIVLAKIAATPGLSLSNFTALELTDIVSAANLLIFTQHASAGVDVETTASAFQAAVSANTAFTAFLSAASVAGQTSEGPGDIGNYFPLSQGDAWFYRGTISESGFPTTSFDNTVTFSRSMTLNGVSVAVLSQSSPGNAGLGELYLTKGTSGITNYGNNDTQDFFTPQLTPYQEIRFPLKIGAPFEQLNKSGLNWPDSDYDGRSETANAVSVVTIAGFEDVTVTAGTFSNCAKVVAVLTVTITFSTDGSKAELTETDTTWYAPGIGPIKKTSVIEATGQGIVFSEADQLTAYVVSGQANGVSVQIAPAAASVFVGGIQQFTATARDRFNNPIQGLTFSWASSNPAAATVNIASGLATGVAFGVTQITASTLGIISSPVTLQVNDQRQIALPAKDLIYDPLRKLIYASVPGSAGALGNTITVIDPETGLVGTSVFVGSEPGKLAISGNGQYLYVALDGAAAIRRLILATLTPDIQFSLGSDSSFGLRYAEDIEVLPGVPESVAVSRKYLSVSPRHAGVGIYDNGVTRPVTTPDFSGSGVNINAIEFSTSATRLYGYNNETTGTEFRRMTVNSSGVSILDATGLIQGGGDIKFDNGLIYANNGAIIDPEARKLVGTCTLSTIYSAVAVRPDSANNLAFFLEYDFYASSWKIEAFNTTTFVSLGSLTVPGIPYTPMPGSLIRWGKNGLAFRASNNNIYLVRSALIP